MNDISKELPKVPIDKDGTPIIVNKFIKDQVPVDKFIDRSNWYIGPDGVRYETAEELFAAQQIDFEQNHRYKSGVTGREYPPTSEGQEQMRQDEDNYWTSQKKQPSEITREY